MIHADLRARLDDTFDALDVCDVEELLANTACRSAAGQAHGLIDAGVTTHRALIGHDISPGQTPNVLTDIVADTARLLATACGPMRLSSLYSISPKPFQGPRTEACGG